MHDTAAAFGAAFFRSYVDAIERPQILEIGSGDVNGSLRGCAPSTAQYTGADLEAGPGVDLVLADPYIYPLDAESFDAIVSSSCLEHDPMFWLGFAEMCRVVRSGGFIYMNAPSNGSFHRHPTDNWRFYPDAGIALAEWGRRNGHDIHLIESFVGRRRRDIWNDCVMIFGKAEIQRPVCLLADLFPRSFNVRVNEEQGFRNYCDRTEDMTIQAWLAEKLKILPEDATELTDTSIGGMIATLAEREVELGAAQRNATERETAAEARHQHEMLAAAERENQLAVEAEIHRAEVARHSSEAEALRAEVARHSGEAEALRAEVARHSGEAEALRAEVARHSGEAEALRAEVTRHSGEAEALRAEVARQSGEAEAEREAADRAVKQLRAVSLKMSAAEREISELRNRAEHAEARASGAESEGSAAVARAAEIARSLAEAQAEHAHLRNELGAVLRSTCWQVTGPVRKAASVLPFGVRKQAKRGARVAYWLLTPHRTRERIAYFRSLRRAAAIASVAEPATAAPSAQPVPFVGADVPADVPIWAEFFDARWYAERYDDVTASGLTPLEHFISHGATAWRDPNPAFDTGWYRRAYPDVAGSRAIPIDHFVRSGAAEGRLPFKEFDFHSYRQQARIAHYSNLETYRHYLRHKRPTSTPRAVWGAATDAEIHCLKEPSFGSEVALLATYSADGQLKPHVLHLVENLRRQQIAVVLIINAEEPFEVANFGVLSQVDGLFVRQAKGYDFAAWAHILQLHRELRDTLILFLINDSIIGPVDQMEFADVIKRIRNSEAAVIGLTDSLDRGWHLQSYFLAFKRSALLSAAFRNFMQQVVCYEDKEDVIGEYELRLGQILKKAGLACEALFHMLDISNPERNPTADRWKELLEAGFPFVKAYIYALPNIDASDCLGLLASKGFDIIRLVRGIPATAEPPDAEPLEPEITPPPISAVACGRPGEVTTRAATWLRGIDWQSRLGQTQAVIGYAAAKYHAAKLSLAFSSPELLDEFQAAMSACAAGDAQGVSTEALIGAIGVSPLRQPPTLTDNFPTVILRRYREAQFATGRRLRVDGRDATSGRGEITVSILMPVYRTPIIYLERALLSVVCQTYSNWELCIVDNGSGDAGIAAVLGYYEALDRRICVVRLPGNAGISAATNAALEMATGAFIGLLDSDDMLTCDALEEIVNRIAEDPTVDLLYTDECKIDENDIVQQLMPKPDWSPLLLTAFMYTGHFSVYRTSLVRRLGGLRSRYDFSQDYDLALRVADLNPRAAHIRGYHYGWRMIRGSASIGEKPHARESNIAALQTAMDRRGWGGTAVVLPMSNRALRTIGEDGPRVSIIVPTGGRVDLLSRCLCSIIDCTAYKNFEIIIVHNDNTRPEVFPFLETIASDSQIRVIGTQQPYNFSQSCNLGVVAASGEVVIFYNDDVFVISHDWIQAMLECLTLPGVGAVGPKLLYKNNGIQHAGMVTATRRLLGTAFHTYPRSSPANMNIAQSVREVSLLSGACLAMRKTVFNEIGGYDEINTPREHSDVDLCFRIRERGYSCVYTPHAELTHLGHVTMGAEEAERIVCEKGKQDIYLLKRFGSYVADDPYFPEPMRDILYIDSPETFKVLQRRAVTHVEDRNEAGVISRTEGAGPLAAKLSEALDILILSHDLSESGAPRAAFDVARSLRNAGHFVVVASPSDGPYQERLRNIGVDVIIDELLLKQDRNFLDFARNFDKVICNTIVCWPAVAQLHRVVDTCWYVHESEGIRQLAEDAPGFVAALKTRVSVWADGRIAERILRTYGVEPRIIEYGVDDPAALGLAPARGGGDPDVVIGVFGSYEPRKGQDLAVKGMLSLAPELRARAQLRLFGRTLEANFRNQLEQIAGLDKSIVFFGEVDQEECLRQMAACDVILVPSRDDALNFVALDALSLGKAVICSGTTGASEYLQDGSSALILKENTPEEIARVLSSVIVDAELRATLGKGARGVYERTFTVRNFAERLHAALGTRASSCSDHGP